MTIDFLRKNNLIIFEAISGSQAYGTTTATSDTDIRGVFMLPIDGLYSFREHYIKQIGEDGNDVVFYELERFLEMLEGNKSNALELVNTPEDCVIYKHPLFDYVLEQKDKFLSKKCRYTFTSFIQKQIDKAQGTNKKQQWKKDKTERREVLDFCYTTYRQGSQPMKDWLKERNIKQEDCGLVSIPHMRYAYSVFHDPTGTKKYKGIVQDETSSNDISLSSVPDKDAVPICSIQFNKDDYSVHCKRYREYQTWLKEANVTRWVETKTHGQTNDNNDLIDGKNMLHTIRLLEMAQEIAQGKGVIIRRPNAKELLEIRFGKTSLKDLIAFAEKGIENLIELYEKSNLPDSADHELANELLVKIRTEFYK